MYISSFYLLSEDSRQVLNSMYDYDDLTKLVTEIRMKHWAHEFDSSSWMSKEEILKDYMSTFKQLPIKDEFLKWVKETSINGTKQVECKWEVFYAPVTHDVRIFLKVIFSSKDIAMLFKLRWQ